MKVIIPHLTGVFDLPTSGESEGNTRLSTSREEKNKKQHHFPKLMHETT